MEMWRPVQSASGPGHSVLSHVKRAALMLARFLQGPLSQKSNQPPVWWSGWLVCGWSACGHCEL